MRLLFFLSLLVVLINPVISQNVDSTFAILLLKKDKELKIRNDLKTFSKRGFILCPNIYYKLSFANDEVVFGKMVKISIDSLYITNEFNKLTSTFDMINYDTLNFSIKDIISIHLSTNGFYGFYREIDLTKYNISTIRTHTCPCDSIRLYLSEGVYYTKEYAINKNISIQISTKGKDNLNSNIVNGSFILTNDGIAIIYLKSGVIMEANGYRRK